MSDKKTVLVVDDEMHLRLFLSAVFDTAGYEALSARNGAEGLIKAREIRPDLISLDLMMPGEGGIKMLSGLKAEPLLAQIPVMIVSAVSEEVFKHTLGLLRAGLSSELPGPEAFVPKPPNPELVLATAARLLAGQAA